MIPPPPPPTRDKSAHSSAPANRDVHRSSYNAPPAPPSNPPQPNVREPYGQVTSSSSVGVSQRRASNNSATLNSVPAYGYGAGSSSSYAIPPTSYAKPQPQIAKRPSIPSDKPLLYRHNAQSLTALTTTFASLLWWHESAIIIEIFAFIGLILYGLDLCNARDSLAVSVWIAAFVLTMASGIGSLLLVDDADAVGVNMLIYLLQLLVEGVLFFSMACWITLQFKWLHTDMPSMAVTMERSLHALIPPMSAAILTYHSLRLLVESWGLEKVAILAPHLFALLMTLGMISLGCQRSSYETVKNNPNPRYAISSSTARIHSMLLLMMPGAMHILNFRRRIFSQFASLDTVFDLMLVWIVPYLLHCFILVVADKSPYEMKNKLFPHRGQETLQGTVVPVGASILASLAVQQRYLLPLCHAMSYRFHGHSSAPTWVLSMYLTVSTVSALFAMWTWGRQSTVTNEPLFGEYHEDVVQLSICICGLLAGKAFGMPWNLTPLPTLAFLGLSIWFSTKMLRYLCIFLFVVYATGVVLFTYRFASIELTIPLVVPGVELRLVRFGELEVFASLFIGLVVGFAVRPTGGVGADVMRKIDVPGLCFICYALLLEVLELTLLKRSAPLEYVGQEISQAAEGGSFLYDHATVFITSSAVAGIAAALRRTTVISKKSWVIILSIAIGKSVAAFIDMNELDSKIRSDAQHESLSHRAFYRSMCATILCSVMLAPRAFLRPIYIKSNSRFKRAISDGRQLGSVPKRAFRCVVLYSLILLPAALVSSVPMVLTPVTMVVSSHYEGGAYYTMAPPVSEMFGFAIALWGMGCFSLLNHYFPDGGCEIWKKVSALAIVMGAGIAASAPSVPEWLGGDSGFGISNPYASISILGSRIVKQRRSRTGGWGILLASLATLLAITGPLELRERRHPSGRKDKKLLFRMMIFSVMFGSGVSWFITIQCMGQARPFVMVTTGVCAMVVAFFGTVTCVLGYFLELESFDEVEQMITISFGSFCIFGIVAGVPSFVLSSAVAGHPFGADGWVAAYLSVCCTVAVALSSVLRMRQTKDQNSRGLGNLACIFAYLLATILIYGRFGVAGVDHVFDARAIYGIPAPVLGTFFISPIMLLLEGETSNERRSRVSRISGTNAKSATAKKTLGINFPNLTQSNQLVPSLVASIFVFLTASLYTIFIRGFFSLEAAETSDRETLATSGNLIAMAQQTISHNKAMTFASRLANASLWTSSNMVGPIIHISGLIATVPSLYLLVTGMWYSSNVPKAQVTLFLPFNAIAIFFCTGTPTLRAVGAICVVGGIMQVMELSRRGHRSQMRM